MRQEKKPKYSCFLKIKVYAANLSPKNKLVVHHTHIRESTYRQRIQQGLECEFKTRELFRVSTTEVTILVIQKKMYFPRKNNLNPYLHQSRTNGVFSDIQN